MTHKYQMLYRPFGINCQPTGAVYYTDANRVRDGYHGIVEYDRELTPEEISRFELKEIVEQPEGVNQ